MTIDSRVQDLATRAGAESKLKAPIESPTFTTLANFDVPGGRVVIGNSFGRPFVALYHYEVDGVTLEALPRQSLGAFGAIYHQVDHVTLTAVVEPSGLEIARINTPIQAATPVNVIDADYTLHRDDRFATLVVGDQSVGVPITITIPSFGAEVPFGSRFNIIDNTHADITFAGDGGNAIQSLNDNMKSAGINGQTVVTRKSATTYTLSGDLTA